MKKILFITLTTMSLNAMAQNVMSPELLWKLGRVTTLGISKDGKNVVYKVGTPSIEENKSDSKFYTIPVNGGVSTEVKDTKDILKDKNISDEAFRQLILDEYTFLKRPVLIDGDRVVIGKLA